MRRSLQRRSVVVVAAAIAGAGYSQRASADIYYDIISLDRTLTIDVPTASNCCVTESSFRSAPTNADWECWFTNEEFCSPCGRTISSTAYQRSGVSHSGALGRGSVRGSRSLLDNTYFELRFTLPAPAVVPMHGYVSANVAVGSPAGFANVTLLTTSFQTIKNFEVFAFEASQAYLPFNESVSLPAGSYILRASAGVYADGATTEAAFEFLFGDGLDGWCIADINGDGFLDATDYDEFINLLVSGNGIDLNCDGFPDASDIDEFIALFLSSCIESPDSGGTDEGGKR